MIRGIIDSTDKIVRNGLFFYVDASQLRSYSGTGTTWTDLSRNNNGTLTNGPTFNSSNGGSISFDGTDDFAGFGNIGSISSFSVLVWFYPTAIVSYKNVLDCNFNYNATTGNIGPRLEMDSSGALGWVYSNITTTNDWFYVNNVLSSGLSANTWHFSAITYDSSANTSTSYYNGSATAFSRLTYGSPTGFIGTMNNVVLGKGFFLDSARAYAGRISNVTIYNRSLSASEVSQNYTVTKKRFGL